MAIYGAVLFFLLSPGVLFRFPSKKPVLVLAVHAVLFAIIYQLTYKAVYRQIYGREGFVNAGDIFNILVGVFFLVIFLGGLAQLYGNRQSPNQSANPSQTNQAKPSQAKPTQAKPPSKLENAFLNAISNSPNSRAKFSAQLAPTRLSTN